MGLLSDITGGIGDFFSGVVGEEPKREQAQWGAGIPQWLQDAYKNLVTGNQWQTGADPAQYVNALAGLYGQLGGLGSWYNQLGQYLQTAGLPQDPGRYAQQIRGMQVSPTGTIGELQKLPGGYSQMMQYIANLAPAMQATMPQLQGDLWPFYRESTKAGWATGARALDELGLTGGRLGSAQTSMAEQLGQQLATARQTARLQSQQEYMDVLNQQANRLTGMAGIMGQAGSMYPILGNLIQGPLQVQMQAGQYNQQALQNAQSMMNQYTQLAQGAVGAGQNLTQGMQGLYGQQAGMVPTAYGLQGSVGQQNYQNYLSALNAAAGMPQYGTTPGQQGFWGALGSTAMDLGTALGSAWAFGQGMGNRGGTAPTNYGAYNPQPWRY